MESYERTSSEPSTLSLMDVIFSRLESLMGLEHSNAKNLDKFVQSLEHMLALGAESRNVRPDIAKLKANSVHSDLDFAFPPDDRLFPNARAVGELICSDHFTRMVLRLLCWEFLNLSLAEEPGPQFQSNLVLVFDSILEVSEMLKSPFLGNAHIIERFAESGNLELVVRALSVLEGIFSPKIDFFKKNSDQLKRLERNFDDFMAHLLRGVQLSSRRQSLLEELSRTAREAVSLTERLCGELNSQLLKAAKNRNRLGLTAKLCSVLMFVETFTSVDSTCLTLCTNKSLRRRPANETLSRDKTLLKHILKNMVYKVKLLHRGTRESTRCGSDEFSRWGSNVILVKCLIRRHPELRLFAHDFVMAQVWDLLLDPFRRRAKVAIVQGLFEMLYRVFFDALPVERLFLWTAAQALAGSKGLALRDAAAKLVCQCESLVQFCRVRVLADHPESFKRFARRVDLSMLDSNLAGVDLLFQHVLLERFCRLDSRKNVIRFSGGPQEIEKMAIHESFYGFDPEAAAEAAWQSRNSGLPLSEHMPKVFVPDKNKHQPEFGVLVRHMLEYCIDVFESFEEAIFAPKPDPKKKVRPNDFNESVTLLASHIKTVVDTAGSVHHRESFWADFMTSQRQTYKDTFEVLRVLESLQACFDRQVSFRETVSQPQPEQQKEHPVLKKRQKKCLKKIFRKVGKTRTNSKPSQPEQPESVCVICQTGFAPANRPFVIADFIRSRYQTPQRVGSRDAFRMLKTCGHSYHFDCLASAQNSWRVTCHYCATHGQFFLGNLSLYQEKDPGHSAKLRDQHRQMLAELSISEDERATHFDLLIAPIVWPIVLVSSFDPGIFERAFAPCLPSLVSLVHDILAVDSEQAGCVLDACQKHLFGVLRPFASFGNLGQLRESFRPQDPEFQVCVEDVLVRACICSYFIHVSGELQTNSGKSDRKPIAELAKVAVEKAFACLVPWLFLLKVLQSDDRNGEALTFTGVERAFPEFVEVLALIRFATGLTDFGYEHSCEYLRGKPIY